MPFTPFHFGPHGCVALSLHRRLDVVVFVGANVAVDLEPLLAMVFRLDYPLHGYCHTFLVGAVVGAVFATALYPFRGLIGKGMALLRLPYAPACWKMLVSGVLGVWLHVLFDAVLYRDMRPFFPSSANPLYGLLSPRAVRLVCSVSFIPALLLYFWLAFAARRRA